MKVYVTYNPGSDDYARAAELKAVIDRVAPNHQVEVVPEDQHIGYGYGHPSNAPGYESMSDSGY